MNLGMWNYGVKVESLDACVAFYVKHMGAVEKLRGELLGCRYALVRAGGMRVVFFEKMPYENATGEDIPYGFIHAVYEVDDFDTVVGKLKEDGVEFIMGPMEVELDFGKRKLVFFDGPDGIRTEVMQVTRDYGNT